MSKDWISTAQVDPRLPTDPEFVSIDALADNYKVGLDTLIRLAIEYPRLAQTSEGNPWTESAGKENLYLHEPSVASHFEVLDGPNS